MAVSVEVVLTTQVVAVAGTPRLPALQATHRLVAVAEATHTDST